MPDTPADTPPRRDGPPTSPPEAAETETSPPPGASGQDVSGRAARPKSLHPEVALFIRTYSRYGGVEQFCYRFHEYLRARGIPVQVLCGEVAPEMFAAAPHNDAPPVHPDAAPSIVDIRELGLWRPGRFLKNLGLYFAAARALRELPPTTVTVGFGNMAGCHIHRSGGPHHDFLRDSLAAQRSPLRRLWKSFSRMLNPNNLLMLKLDKAIYTHPATRCIIAISQNVRAAVVRRFPHSPAAVVVIPNGVDSQRFNTRHFASLREQARQTMGLSPRHRVIGFCSSNFELKGLDRLIAALTRLPAEYVLVVAGGRSSRKYRDYADSLGVRRRMLFLGKVTAADMPRFYAALDIFCHPSFYDTFGNVVAEAQAMGIPTVTTSATGACDLIDNGRTGRVLDVPEPWALANAILELHDVAAGTAFSRVADDEQVFDRYLAVIRAVRAKLSRAPTDAPDGAREHLPR